MTQQDLLQLAIHFFNIRRFYTILYNPTPPDVPELLISFDAAKAFDGVEWDYLFILLDLGLGPNSYPGLRFFIIYQ